MPISVHWPSRVISVPKSYLTPLGGNVYELDVERFRLDLKDLEDGEQGISWPDTHRRNAPVTLAGATYAQTFEVINGYTITFEDVGSPYAVSIVGANSNVAEVANVNSVSLRSNNSAGLISVEGGGGGGGGPTAGQIAAAVWDEELEGHDGPGTAGKTLSDAERLADMTQAAVGH